MVVMILQIMMVDEDETDRKKTPSKQTREYFHRKTNLQISRVSTYEVGVFVFGLPAM